MAVLVGAAIDHASFGQEKNGDYRPSPEVPLYEADAAESALCAYLSIIALMGLVVHAIWHIA